MLQRIDYEDEHRKPEDIRNSFDNQMAVSAWRTPIGGAVADNDRPDGAPSWWVSDEEAAGPWVAMAQAQGME